MHEISIMMSILDTALEIAENNQAKKIERITIEIGDKSGVVKDALDFAFETVTRDTIAEGAVLDVIRIPLKGECSHCGHIFTSESFLVCDKCGNLGKMISGNELRIKSIEVN